MGIFRSMGLGMFFLVLAIAMPLAFAELSKTIVVFLQSSQQAFTAAGILASYAGTITPDSLSHP